MDSFISALSTSLTPHVISSMLGGFLGALISSDKERYGWQLSLLFMIASVAASAAAGEHLNLEREVQSLWWIFVLNIPLGMVVGATLDVIRITSPPLIRRLIIGVTESAVNLVIESVLRKIANIFGVDVKVGQVPSAIKDVEEGKARKRGVSRGG